MRTRHVIAAAFLACSSLVLSLGAAAEERGQTQEQRPAEAAKQDAADRDAAVVAAQKPSYPLTKCPVSGSELGSMGAAIDLVVDGRLIRLCCKGCSQKAQTTSAEVIAKIDAAVIAAQLENYPLESCAVSGEELGSMGDPIDLVHGTRLVRLCCAGCVKGFRADPAATMTKIDAAYIAAQIPEYPLGFCFVSNEPLVEGSAVDMLYGTELVRFCCASCKRSFDKAPEASIAELHKAKRAAKQPSEQPTEETPEQKRGA